MPYTYVSLFSSGGLGCYGLSQAGFQCLVTAELESSRLAIQQYNKKCRQHEDYVSGDLTDDMIYQKVLARIAHYTSSDARICDSVDVLVATPPCQGMSTSNYKKKNELQRNSLVVKAIKAVGDILPKAFFFENVKAFMTTTCVDSKGESRQIGDYLYAELSERYHIFHRVINLKDYGCPSSRPRTIVVGTRKDILELNPLSIFPLRKRPSTVRAAIGDLPSLQRMGLRGFEDELHFFRPYHSHMRDWLTRLPEGASALNNKAPHKPYKILKDGSKAPYASTHINNKFSRLYWDKPGKCIATRSDQMHSQDTLHPSDDRVLSIRELMRLMTVPDDFQWFKPSEVDTIQQLRKDYQAAVQSLKQLSLLDSESALHQYADPNPENDLITVSQRVIETSQAYQEGVTELLRKNELNIRRLLGEAVPTFLFAEMGRNFIELLEFEQWKQSYKPFEGTEEAVDAQVLKFVKNPAHSFYQKTYVVEYNQDPVKHGKYYTPQHVVYNLLRSCKVTKKQEKSTVRILEPTVGAGNFLRQTLALFGHCKQVDFTLCDMDSKALKYTECLVKSYFELPNAHFQFICQDIMEVSFQGRFDFTIANPPYGSLKGKPLKHYRGLTQYCKDTKNIFTFVLEKVMSVSDQILLVLPKTFIMSPEYNALREQVQKNYCIREIHDYGVKAFPEVFVEILSIYFTSHAVAECTIVDHIAKERRQQPAGYIFHDKQWLLYRDAFFDDYIANLQLDVFSFFRDRQIKTTDVYQSDAFPSEPNATWVVKSKNVADSGELRPKPSYDVYLNNPLDFTVSQYCFKRQPFFVTFTYNIRLGYLPDNAIVNGSLALIFPKDNCEAHTQLVDYRYFSTADFRRYYAVVKNRSKFTLNIDRNTIYYLGLHQQHTHRVLMQRCLDECAALPVQPTLSGDLVTHEHDLKDLNVEQCAEATALYAELVGYSSVASLKKCIQTLQNSHHDGHQDRVSTMFARKGTHQSIPITVNGQESNVIVQYDVLGYPIFLPDNGLLYDLCSKTDSDLNVLNRVLCDSLTESPHRDTAFVRQLQRFGFAKEAAAQLLADLKQGTLDDRLLWHPHQETGRFQLILKQVYQRVDRLSSS